MSATKRIPVSEETWKELGREKDPGQTWDELLRSLREQAMRNQLVEKAQKAKEGELETVSLDDV
ncbi:MAG: hypothetical protein ABEJ64_02575 [Candidatus Nanohaloarchaea archaeon]